MAGFSPPCSDCFNGAAASMLRKFENEMPLGSINTSFNGAAASMLRKWSACFRAGAVLSASMGPQHRCCGNLVREECQHHDYHGFNGAAASMLRKYPVGRFRRRGHPRFNGAAASMLRKFFVSLKRSVMESASMGPQHRCCGNDRSGAAGAYVRSGFNGAAASMLRKFPRLPSGGPRHRASMGPQHRCCGN